MTSILSAISGQFGKNLILGAFLPVVVFVTLNLIFVVPLFPEGWPPGQAIAQLDAQWRLVTVTFISIVLTGLLMNLNVPIVRLYEGYPWMQSWIGQLMISHWQSRFVSLRSRRLGMRTLVRDMKNAKKNADEIAKITAIRGRTARRLNSHFPSKASLIIPTRLGNVIRSFEEYPDRQYGISAVALLPRLVAKIEKEYAIGIDDARASFDFMLNNSILSYLSALLLTVAGLFYFPPRSLFYPTQPVATRVLTIVWLATILGFVVLGYLAYLGAIERASAWGAKVKGAFDLYRGELLKQIGYQRTLSTMRDERQLWDAISLQMIYGDPPWGRDPAFEYQTSSTLVRSDPPFVDLQILRGIGRPDADGTITTTIRLRNNDSEKRNAKNVVVTDTVIDGYHYEWDSAELASGQLSGQAVQFPSSQISGTNPYDFRIGHVPFNGEVTLRYRIIPRKK